MRIALILLFIALPLLELAVLIKIGQWMGFWWTMLLLVATAIGGGLVVHAQGFAALRRMNEAMAQGRPPIEPVVDSVFLMVAGALMLTPGLITDVAGGLLLVPPVRRAIARYVFRHVLTAATVRVQTGSSADAFEDRHRPQGTGARHQGDGVVIDGEWEEVKEPDSKPTSVPPHRRERR